MGQAENLMMEIQKKDIAHRKISTKVITGNKIDRYFSYMKH